MRGTVFRVFVFYDLYSVQSHGVRILCKMFVCLMCCILSYALGGDKPEVSHLWGRALGEVSKLFWYLGSGREYWPCRPNAGGLWGSISVKREQTESWCSGNVPEKQKEKTVLVS